MVCWEPFALEKILYQETSYHILEINNLEYFSYTWCLKQIRLNILEALVMLMYRLLAALQKPHKASMKNIWPLNEREKWMYEKRVWEEIYTYKYFFEIVKTKKEDGIRNDVEAKTFPRFLLLNKQAQPRSEPKALFGWRSIHSFSPFPNYNKFQAHETC